MKLLGTHALQKCYKVQFKAIGGQWKDRIRHVEHSDWEVVGKEGLFQKCWSVRLENLPWIIEQNIWLHETAKVKEANFLVGCKRFKASFGEPSRNESFYSRLCIYKTWLLGDGS